MMSGQKSETAQTTEAERLHGHLVGQQGSRRSLNTPALVLDLEMLDRNIAAMAAFAKEHDIKLRPHSKTHKSLHIARRQIAAGAIGICCAKLGEAEALGDGGIEHILVTSPVVTPQAIARLIALNEVIAELMVVVGSSCQRRGAGRGRAKRRQAADRRRRHRSRHAPHRRRHRRPKRSSWCRRSSGSKSLEVRRRAVLLRAAPAHRRLKERKAEIEERTGYLKGRSSTSSKRRG